MGISCKSWGEKKSIEKKLEYRRMLATVQKPITKPKETEKKKETKEKSAKGK